MWIYAVVVMLAAFFTSTAIAAVRDSIHPPSHVETIEPRRAMAGPRFHPRGVSVDGAGRVHAPVTLHITSTGVQHGYQFVCTNGQAQILPGYVSQFTTELEPGE